jgi:membrane protein YqaA with SNARE-associated domain
MSFRDQIETAATSNVNCAQWIHIFNLLIIVFAIVGAPFTLFASLFALLAVPFNSAAAAIANNTHRQKELTHLHLLLLADYHRLD